MPRLRLASHHDMAQLMSFDEVGENAFSGTGYGGSNVNVTKTYDTDSGIVTFEYPELKTGSPDTLDALEIIRSELSNKLKRYERSITVDTSAGHLKIEMPERVFRQAFNAQIKVELERPFNLLHYCAASVAGSQNLTQAVLNLDNDRVSLYYDDIHTDSGAQKATAALLRGVDHRQRHKLRWGQEGGVYVISMPADTYEKLSGETLPKIHQAGRGR